MEGQLVLLPREVWGLIWGRLPLRHKFRLELCSTALHRDLWLLSPILELDPTLAPPEAVIRVFASRPASARALRRFEANLQAHLSHLPLDSGFSHTTALTHICIKESKSAVFNALVAAQCPLRNVSIISSDKSFYDTLELRGFEVFKATLRRLSLLVDYFDRPTPPSEAFLEALITHLGPTLETLSLNLRTPAPLKPMAALKELFLLDRHTSPKVMFNLEDPSATASLILAQTPPGVGLNFVLLGPSIPNSFLMHAIGVNALMVKELLAKYPLDVNLAPFPMPSTTNRRSLLLRAISDSQYDIARLLIEKGARLVCPKARSVLYRSAFRATLAKWTLLISVWHEFASWLFDKHWATALGEWSESDLLCCDPSDLLSHLFRASPSTFAAKLQFVQARPAMFGPQSAAAVSHRGCNLAHICHGVSAAKMLNDLGVDWRVKDKAGLDALECLAATRSVIIGPDGLLEHWCQSDEDFVAHCTPLVWGRLESAMDFSPDGTPPRPFVALVQRMMKLYPREQWEEVATAIHIQLRDNPNVNVVGAWLSAGGPEFRPALLRALFRPWSQLKQASWIKFIQFDEFCLRPLPQWVRKEAQLELFGRLAKSHFSSEAEAMEWVNERHDDGLTATEYFIAKNGRGTPGARLRLDLLALLWPPDPT